MAAASWAAVIPRDMTLEVLPYIRRAADPAVTGWERIDALHRLVHDVQAQRPGGAGVPRPSGEINNHIHTIYSFSPYTPAMAAWRARAAGLAVAGSVDHDSIAAAGEMLAACAALGIGGTVGCELRVSCIDSPFGKRKLNNPDSTGIAYMTIQGIPRHNISRTAAFLEPIGIARGQRNRRTTQAASDRLSKAGYGPIDYDKDVLPLSKSTEHGSVTERHILAAAATAIMARHGSGSALVTGVSSQLGIHVPARLAALLADPGNPHALYDLIGLLKASLLDTIFVQPGADECIPVRTATAFARGIGAIPAYAYLGDVADSPTGDKKAEKFEDDFLDALLPWLVDTGFQAITYMPPRNTPAQLSRLRSLCERHGLMEISGVDINSSRQSFNCPEVLQPTMSRLIDTTWALVAHEKLSGMDPALGLFATGSPQAVLPLPERIDRYAAVGRGIDPEHPEDPAALSRLIRDWR
jgi:hypothetical protein